jgi:hypothetical protein
MSAHSNRKILILYYLNSKNHGVCNFSLETTNTFIFASNKEIPIQKKGLAVEKRGKERVSYAALMTQLLSRCQQIIHVRLNNQINHFLKNK